MLIHTPLVEKAVQALIDLIASDEFTEGNKLPSETALCTRFGISRSTLREAYRTLQAMGYLDLKPGRGAFIFSKSQRSTDYRVMEWFSSHGDELFDIFIVREAIDLLAVELSICRADDREMYEILGISTLFEQAVNEGNSSKMALYDELFHQKIVVASHHRLLIGINEQISKALAPYRSKSFAIEKNAFNAVAPHRAIATALTERNIEKAKHAVSHHIEISKIDIEASVGKGLDDVHQ